MKQVRYVRSRAVPSSRNPRTPSGNDNDDDDDEEEEEEEEPMNHGQYHSSTSINQTVYYCL
jgi:hypothetical protein